MNGSEPAWPCGARTNCENLLGKICKKIIVLPTFLQTSSYLILHYHYSTPCSKSQYAQKPLILGLIQLSKPAFCAIVGPIFAPIAQLVEQLPFKEMVVGSNPTGRTIDKIPENGILF